MNLAASGYGLQFTYNRLASYRSGIPKPVFVAEYNALRASGQRAQRPDDPSASPVLFQQSQHFVQQIRIDIASPT